MALDRQLPTFGQLQSMTSSSATVNYGSYDVLGRMGSNTQTTNGNAYTFQYTYRLNDSISSMQYPSGKTVNYAVDDAGRVNQIHSRNKTYADLTASSAPFTADGRIAQMKLGNDLWETRSYQTPGTPTLLKLGTAAGANDKLELEYDYSATANNGNLAMQVIRQPGHTWTQNYTYDSLNRLASAVEANGFSRTYGYDRYGNRWVAASSGITAADSHEPTAGTLFNAANNRLANQSYDAAGNQTSYDPRIIVLRRGKPPDQCNECDQRQRILSLRRRWPPRSQDVDAIWWLQLKSRRTSTDRADNLPQSTRTKSPHRPEHPGCLPICSAVSAP